MTRTPKSSDQAPECARPDCGELVQRSKSGDGWWKWCSDRCRMRVGQQKSRARNQVAVRQESKLDPEAVGMAQIELGAEDLGVDWKVLGRIVQRLRENGEIPAVPEVITSEYIAEILEQKAVRIALSIDDLDVLRSDLKSKVSAISGLLDKRQLLRGEPTQIRSYAERRDMHDSLKALLVEAQKRGMLTDARFSEVEG